MRVKQTTQTWGIRLLVLILCLVTHTTTNRLEAQNCDFYEGDVSFNSEGGNRTTNYQTKYFLINPADSTILYLSETPSFEDVIAGNYEIFAINYNKQFKIVGLNINSNIKDIKSLCPPDMSGPLSLRVCSKPEITTTQIDTIDYCLGNPLPIFSPDINIDESDGDSLEIHISIITNGDSQMDFLNLDSQAFSNAITLYSYPNLIIRASDQSASGIDVASAESIISSVILNTQSASLAPRTISARVVDASGNYSNSIEVVLLVKDCTNNCPAPSITNITEELCAGDVFDFNGTILSQSGLYIDTLKNIIGCDSIVVLDLKVRETIEVQYNLEICPGDEITFNEKQFDSPGIFEESFISSSGCDSTVILNLSFGTTICPVSCADVDLFTQRSDIRFQENCNNPYEYCLPIHKDSIHRYEIMDNGLTVSQLSTCSPDTVVFYSYMSLASEAGPFEVSMWNVGDRSFRANFDDFDQLAMYMEAWDVIGHWANNSNARIIEGPQIRDAYGALEIIQVRTGKSWSIEPDRRIQGNNFISIPLSIGDHELVIVDTILMCMDTLDITIVCDDAVSYVPEFISLYDTVQVGWTDTFCLDHPGVEIVGIYNECEPSSGEYVRFGTNASCITFEGIEVGLDSFCVVACGPIGDCDTTTLYVNVIPTITRPEAVNDTASTVETVPVFVDIMFNDDLNNGTLQDIYVLDDPDFGTVTIDRFNENIAEYVPRENFCGWIDSFTYVIVNEVSQDTATVIVDIKCDSLRILNGFSPNGDGVNDVFVILGIEDIEENRVRTYNRWGTLVYSKERYTNQEGWDGTWENIHLPDGTYFYTIEDKARRVIRSGWVQIFRG